MAFIDTRMPRRIAAGFTVGPEWKTLVVPLDNGREQRNRQWLYPRWRGQGNMGSFKPADRQELMGMFVAVGGRLNAFRFFDPTDHSVEGEAIAPSIGTSSPVQLVRTYGFGSASAIVLIQAPVAGTVTVFRNGVAVSGTLDATTGLFTPAAPWVAGTFTWTGQYDRWMRFDSDWSAFTADALDVWTADIDLIEVRR